MRVLTVRTGANPTVRASRINDNGYEAVCVQDRGRGTFEDNDLTGNRRGAWNVDRSCRRKVRAARNRDPARG